MRDDAWHDKEEIFLNKVEHQCNSYANYFNKDYMYYHSLSARFNIPILVISSLNALCAVALNEFLEQKFVSILNAVLSAGTGVLGSIQLYMKINEKMTNAVRSQMLMKRLALKISKELSIDRAQRATDGQIFLQECFGEFNAALEQANPIEKKLNNFLALNENQASAPNTPSYGLATLREKMTRLSEPPAKTLWGLFGTGQKASYSLPESSSRQYQSESTPGEESPKGRDEEP
jgi:hypothetical protein